ncbi:COR domain-containing protein, partial [Pseudomonadota bacterium]
VYTFSVKHDRDQLLAFRQAVADFIKHNPSWEKQLIPTSYYHVKAALEELFDKQNGDAGREHISRDEFDDIARQYKVEDSEQLLKDLHSLGVSLWYEGMDEFDTLVLNPEWISHGVYKIINWVNEAKKHAITLEDFATVFEDDLERYPVDKHSFLFKLMKHYELAYEAASDKKLIIPHLLNEDRPEVLPDFPVGESLMLRYKAEQPLPPNTISRFIVRHNEQIKKSRHGYPVWRDGVVLEDSKGSTALVREDDRTISVAVKGKDKTHYISTLRDTLDEIFGSYKSKAPELQYRIERFGQFPASAEEPQPLWLGGQEIANHVKRDRPFYDSASDQELSLRPIAKQYNINANNVILDGQGHSLVEDKSTNTHFNFYDCNIGLQGDLNNLAHLLTKNGNQEEAEELKTAAELLEQAEQCDSPEDIKKKGIANSLRRVVEELNDEQSTLNKSVKGIRKGIGIAQDIAAGYNKIAEWVGMPIVPKPFLKKAK